jgi:hypothetical protein
MARVCILTLASEAICPATPCIVPIEVRNALSATGRTEAYESASRR